MVVLLFAALVLFTARMGDLSLPSLEDAFYGREAVEMARSGRIYTVTWNGEPTHQHPPLHLWLVARTFDALGERDLAARLPTVVLALGTMLLTWRIGVLTLGRAAAVAGDGVPPRDADLRRQRAAPDDGGSADLLDHGHRVGVPRGAGASPVAGRARHPSGGGDPHEERARPDAVARARRRARQRGASRAAPPTVGVDRPRPRARHRRVVARTPVVDPGIGRRRLAPPRPRGPALRAVPLRSARCARTR